MRTRHLSQPAWTIEHETSSRDLNIYLEKKSGARSCDLARKYNVTSSFINILFNRWNEREINQNEGFERVKVEWLGDNT